MPNSGYSQAVRWGNETAYASTAVISKDMGVVQSMQPSEKNNLFKIRTIGGNRDYKTIVPGKFEISGRHDYYLQGGAFLRQAFGEDTATTSTIDSGAKLYGGVASLYKHCMGSANSPGVNAYPSFSLEFTDYEDTGALTTTKNLKRVYTGCRVNNLTITSSVDEPVKCAVDWMAKRVTVSTGAATSITEYTEDPFVFYQGYVFLTSGVATCGTPQATLKGSVLALINNFDFSINNNCEAGWYISGTTSATDSARSAKFIIPKGRDYSLKLGMHFNTKDLYQKFLGATGATTDQKTMAKYQVVLDMLRGTGTIGTPATGLNYIRLMFSSAVFDDIAVNGAPEDIVNQDITVFAKNVKCWFVDSVASYK